MGARRIPANQLTQQMYGLSVTFGIPVKRGQSIHTLTLGHVMCDGQWVLIGAKGSGPWDRYRVRADTIVEVRG